MATKIEIISKELIKPSSPNPHDSTVHKLSFLDQLNFPTYISLICFYQNDESSRPCIDHGKRSQLLKQSLSETLATYYPLAGRIKGNFLVDCNDSGALFIEAQVHCRLTQKAIPIEELNRYLPLDPYNQNLLVGPNAISNDVLLAIQLNSFECGGTAIGVCISHKIADAMSLVTFMNTWAAKNRGNNADEEIVRPSFDLGSHLFPPLDEEPSFPPITQSPEKEKFVTKRFVFDKEKLAALKDEASSAFPRSHAVENPTRVEAVSAFIWKHYMGISKTKSTLAAVHTVNLRPRMKLPTESFAFGNLAIIATAVLMSKEEDQEYHKLVCHLQNAIEKINDDYVKIIQSGLPYLLKSIKEIELIFNPETSYCFFTSWCRFPIYEVNCGWGKPISVCTPALPGDMVILMNTRCGEGIEAWISMWKNEMALLPDKLLSLDTGDICF
ncbi:hypothetical protein ACH5RR_006650 [Cinchona calisaya]|uniref:Uncharacterized protein n=1 Tax=Cinchona calisaya TaxID=153742 RepID=A0ABD3APJ8_9GENT